MKPSNIFFRYYRVIYLTILLVAAPQPKNRVNSRLLLNVIVRHRPTILHLLGFIHLLPSQILVSGIHMRPRQLAVAPFVSWRCMCPPRLRGSPGNLCRHRPVCTAEARCSPPAQPMHCRPEMLGASCRLRPTPVTERRDGHVLMILISVSGYYQI